MSCWEMIPLCHSKKKGTYDAKWFMKQMQDRFQLETVEKDVSYEAYLFYHEDIDEAIIPTEDLKHLPDPMLLQTYLFIDDENNAWIAGIVIDKIERKLLYEIWRRNGKTLAIEKHETPDKRTE